MIQYVVVTVLLIVGLYFWIKWRSKRAKSIINEWIDLNEYILIEIEYRWIFRGPFSFPSNGLHMVYFGILRDKNGEQYEAYFKIGNWFIGLMSDDFKYNLKKSAKSID